MHPMKLMISLIALLSLNACEGVASEPPAKLPVAAPVEPARIPLKDYPLTLQNRAADELETLPPGSALAGFLTDYGQLRRAVCAAEGWKQPACRKIRSSQEKPDADR